MTKVIKKRPIKTVAVVLLIALFGLSAGTYFLVTTANDSVVQTNTSDKPKNEAVEDIETENQIDYSPAKNEDSVAIPDKQTTSNESSTISSSLSATVTSKRPNSEGTSYLVKVAVSGATAGKCNAILSMGQKELSASSPIELSSGQYSCGSLEFPFQELTLGNWLLTITIVNELGESVTVTDAVTI